MKNIQPVNLKFLIGLMCLSAIVIKAEESSLTLTSPSSSVDSFRAFKEATSFDQAEFIEGDPAVVERLATTLDELESRTQDIPIEVDRTQSRRTELMDHRSSLGRDRLDAPLSVPEPSTVALVIVGAATLLSFHARNDRRQDR